MLNEQKQIGEELNKLLDKGFAMGKLLYEKRAELYDRTSLKMKKTSNKYRELK